MKRTLFFLLTLCLVLNGFAACNPASTRTATAPQTATVPESAGSEEIRSVLSPLKELPVYTLPEGATSDEMRAMAVKAMRDQLTITWYPDQEVKYAFNSGDGDVKNFTLSPYETYAGLPYTNSITSLFHFYDYYDPETGRVAAPQGERFNTLLGNQCAGSVIWGWGAVVDSVVFKNKSVRTSEGVLKVGPYTIPEGELSSGKTCAYNGEQVIYASYAEMKPADILFEGGNGSSGHVMMVVSDPVVVKKGNVIDGKESYVLIQDQRGGARQNTSEYVITEDGEKRHYSGRTEAKLTFEKLFTTYYLPYTCGEFIGTVPYVAPSVSADIEIRSFEDLSKATLSSTRLLCVFNTRVLDSEGKEVYTRRKSTTFEEMNALKLKDFPLKDLNLSTTVLKRGGLTKSGNYTISITVLDASGTRHDVAEFAFTL